MVRESWIWGLEAQLTELPIQLEKKRISWAREANMKWKQDCKGRVHGLRV